MPIIPGVDVDFSGSPRIITIPEPLATVTIQDLHDTLRDVEDFPTNMRFPPLVSSAGKEVLGAGKAVGITSTLLDALLAFAARSGPSYVQCVVSGGNLVAKDIGGNPVFPVDPTAFTSVTIAQSSSPTSLDIGALTLDDFLTFKDT